MNEISQQIQQLKSNLDDVRQHLKDTKKELIQERAQRKLFYESGVNAAKRADGIIEQLCEEIDMRDRAIKKILCDHYNGYDEKSEKFQHIRDKYLKGLNKPLKIQGK